MSADAARTSACATGFCKGSDQIYRAPALDRFSWLRHGFGTRHSPTLDAQIATVRQIHSARVITAERPGLLGEADALIGVVPGLLLAIKTADCLPILFVDPKRPAVAAVHAGWRGTAGKIVQITIRELAREFGSQAQDLHAAIGPGIGECCFEVGPDTAFELVGRRGRMRVDLAGLNRKQLIEAGVDPDCIYSANRCTVCSPDEFFSYRREREQAGRMISFIGIA